MRLARTFRSAPVAGAATLLALGSACGIPTEAPRWDTTWIVPVKSDSVTVSQVVPTGVTVSTGLFMVDVSGDSVSSSLGTFCGVLCAAANGNTVPKPAFSATHTTMVSFPAKVDSVVLAPGNSAQIQIRNGFSFDPIRPAGGPTGRIISTLVAAGNDTLAADTLDGATNALGAGVTLLRTVALPSGRAFAGPITVVQQVISPAGSGLVTIDTAQQFGMTAPSKSYSVSSATVQVVNDTVNSATSTIDLANVDNQIRDRVDSARVEITTQNPLPIVGTFMLHFQELGVDLIAPKNIALAVGTQTSAVLLSGPEIRALLGRTITVSFAGTVSATGGTAITVLPSDQVHISSKVFLHIPLGSGS